MIIVVDICDNCDNFGDDCGTFGDNLKNAGDIKDDDCGEISQIWKLHLRNVANCDRYL